METNKQLLKNSLMSNETYNNITKSLNTLDAYNKASEKELLEVLNTTKNLLIESCIIGGTIATLSTILIAIIF